MLLTLMVKVMQEIPEGSDILFLTNAAYIQNFDKTPTAKSANRTGSESKDASSLAISAESRGRKARANPDLIIQCIEEKKRHNSVGVKIVQYHKSPLLTETHDRATEAMAKTRKEFHQKNNRQSVSSEIVASVSIPPCAHEGEDGTENDVDNDNVNKCIRYLQILK